MNDNCDVIVQHVNTPSTRRVVGALTQGYRPMPDDLARWDISPDRIIESKWTRMSGRPVYLIATM